MCYRASSDWIKLKKHLQAWQNSSSLFSSLGKNWKKYDICSHYSSPSSYLIIFQAFGDAWKMASEQCARATPKLAPLGR